MDEFYNAGFAAKVRSIIAKMDDDEAEMFMRFSTYDVLMADIEANRRTVDRRVNEVHKRLQEGVAKSLASLVSKSASGVDLREVAALVGIVSKAHTPYEELYNREQPRGKGGRWSISISREKHKADPRQPQGFPNVTRDKGDVMAGPEFNLTQALDRSGKHMSQFADRWNKDDPLHASTNKRTYDRIQAGSEALMHSGNPKAVAAGKVGQFFGQYGPEAEKVIGPHMRRTAYRYRGTERRPDPALMSAANQLARETAIGEGNVPKPPMIDANRFYTDPKDPSKKIKGSELLHSSLQHREAQIDASMDPALRTYASQQAAIRYFLGSKNSPSRLPDKKWSQLHQASGKIPPSEGIIINDEGKIITQAVGVADDHYLPFNLKNLKGLQGGHYVRSRSQGGLTTEDIYTGLVSGARSVTVVSRSGVFTMNFSDDFRGGRRYNDKAAHMVGRYAKTLDAVKSQTVDRRPLSLDERAEIRDEVEREFEGDEWVTRADIEDRVKEKETEYKTRPSMTKAELAEIDAKARKGNENDERAYKRERTELISLAQARKAQRSYQLDGEGYDAAMRALKEQFPYYIETVHTKFRDPEHTNVEDPFTNEKDRGYVKPRYVRPEGANEGYFDKTIAGDTGKGTGKITADRTNYQNWAYNPERGRARAATRSAEADGEGTPQSGPISALEVREKIARGQRRGVGDESLKKLVNLYTSRIKTEDLEAYPMVKRASGDGFAKVVDSAADREQLMDDLARLHQAAESEDALKSVHSQADILFKAVRASRSGSHWDAAKAAEKPEQPFEFDLEGGRKAAYALSAKDDEIEKEWEHQQAKVPPSMRGIQINQMSDEDLSKLASAFGYMGHAAQKDSLDPQFAEWAAARGVSEGLITQTMRAAERGEGKKIGAGYLKQAEALHRLRRLQWNLNNNPNRQGAYTPRARPAAEPAAEGQPSVGSNAAPAGTPQLSQERSSQTPLHEITADHIKSFRDYTGQNTTAKNVAYGIAQELQKRKNDAIDDEKLARSIKWLLDEDRLDQHDYNRLKWMAKQVGADVDAVTGEDPDE